MFGDWKTRDNGTMIRRFGTDEAMIIPRAGGRYLCFWIQANRLETKPFSICNGLEEAKQKCVDRAQASGHAVEGAKNV